MQRVLQRSPAWATRLAGRGALPLRGLTFDRCQADRAVTGRAADLERLLNGLDHAHDVEPDLAPTTVARRRPGLARAEVRELERQRLRRRRRAARRCRRCGRSAGTRRTSPGRAGRRRSRRCGPARCSCRRRRPSSREPTIVVRRSLLGASHDSSTWAIVPEANARLMNATSGVAGMTQLRLDRRDLRRAVSSSQ